MAGRRKACGEFLRYQPLTPIIGTVRDRLVGTVIDGRDLPLAIRRW